MIHNTYANLWNYRTSRTKDSTKFCNLRLGNNFLNITPKPQSTPTNDKFSLSKCKTSILWNILLGEKNTRYGLCKKTTTNNISDKILVSRI